jgi:hypothetical protein
MTLIEMLTGHILFIVSGIAYSIHWYLLSRKPGALAKILIAITMVCGLAGITVIILSLFSEGAGIGIELYPVLLACIAAFIAVFYITSILMKRPFTSELPLLLIWAGIEACALIAAANRGLLTPVPLAVCSLLNALSAMAGLVCYALYYRLGKDAQFIDGLIPYLAISFSMTVTAIFLAMGI